MLLALGACGGDEKPSSTPNAGQGGSAGNAGTAGSAGTAAPVTGGSDAVMPLPADTAGKACTSNADCGPGTCAAMVEGLDGAATAAPGGYCMASCTDSTACGSGGTCVPGLMGEGLCYEACAMDSDCREGYLCGPLTSTCRPAPATDQLADNGAGIACAADTECGDGVCLTMRINREPFPGGYCSGACLEDAHCGAGGVCLRLGSAAGRCYETCAADPDCTRDGYRCRDLNDMLKGCLPAPDPLPDNTTALACASDADCSDVMGACATMLPAAAGGEVAAPGGYCTASCEIEADCGAGGTCVVTREGGRCFKPCTAPEECREGYVCGERGFGDPPMTVCTPFEPDPDGGVPDASVTDSGM